MSRIAASRAGLSLAAGAAVTLTLVCLLGPVTRPASGPGVDHEGTRRSLEDAFQQMQADQEIVALLRRAATARHATAQDEARFARARRACRQHAAAYNADASRGWVPANLPSRLATADYCGN